MASIRLEEEIAISSEYWLKDLTLIGLSLGIIFFSLILLTPFAYPDLIRYVSIPQLMIQSGHWIDVYFNKVPNFSDPPIFYWLQATSIYLFGMNTFALKFWSAIFSILGCLATYPLSRAYFGRRTGVMTCFIMATTAISFSYSHVIGPYMVGSIIFSLTILCYLYAWLLRGYARRYFSILFWILLAVSGLTIGLSGIILPLLLLLLNYLLFQKMQFMRAMFSIIGMLLFIAIIGGWLYLGSTYMSDFASKYFLQFNAFDLVDSFYPYRKMLLIVPIMFLAFLPWSVFLINALRISFPSSWKNRDNAAPTFFFLIWIIIVLIELGITVSSLPWLITLSVPVSIMVARYFSLLWDRKHIETTRLSYDIIMYAALIGALVLLAFLYFEWTRTPIVNVPYIQLLMICLLAIALIVIPVIRHRSFPSGFVMLFTANLICLIMLNFCYQYISVYQNDVPEILSDKTLLSQTAGLQASLTEPNGMDSLTL